MPAFWDMGVGVMGAAGFDPGRQGRPRRQGGFALSCWVRLSSWRSRRPSLASPTPSARASSSSSSAPAPASPVRNSSLPSHQRRRPRRASSAAVGGGGGGGSSGGGGELGRCHPRHAAIRCGVWHLLSLGCRRGSVLSSRPSASAGRAAAVMRPSLHRRLPRVPRARPLPAASRRARQPRPRRRRAPAHPRAPAAALRGQLGPFLLFDGAPPAAELEACYTPRGAGSCTSSRVLAAWHPILDRGGATTATSHRARAGAPPRSESIPPSRRARPLGGWHNVLPRFHRRRLARDTAQRPPAAAAATTPPAVAATPSSAPPSGSSPFLRSHCNQAEMPQ